VSAIADRQPPKSFCKQPYQSLMNWAGIKGQSTITMIAQGFWKLRIGDGGLQNRQG
jgi:hypothetical protein